MTRLRLEQSELTYEGTFSQFVFPMLDAPGKLCASLLERLEPFDATIDDLGFEEGEPGERGVTCELEELDVIATVRADRLEVIFSGLDRTGDQAAAKIVEAVWDAVAAVQVGTSPRVHSLLFEMDSAIIAEAYDSVLGRLAPVSSALPQGTETAVVYYLPAEAGRGYRESSLVLNRSSSVNHGLLVGATLVFEGGAMKPGATIASARERLGGLLRSLRIEWVEH